MCNAWSGGAKRAFDRFHPVISGCILIGYDRYRQILDRITERLLILEGRDFGVTPLTAEAGLAAALGRTGRLWVKNETGNVAGSHKGRHLMATLLYLEALRELKGETAKKVQAIYSCGVGCADAALKRWHCGREDRGVVLCAPRFAAVLEHRAPSALAPARPGPAGSDRG